VQIQPIRRAAAAPGAIAEAALRARLQWEACIRPGIVGREVHPRVTPR
jgi:hypothetical protein